METKRMLKTQMCVIRPQCVNFLEPSGPLQACNGIALPFQYTCGNNASRALFNTKGLQHSSVVKSWATIYCWCLPVSYKSAKLPTSTVIWTPFYQRQISNIVFLIRKTVARMGFCGKWINCKAMRTLHLQNRLTHSDSIWYGLPTLAAVRRI